MAGFEIEGERFEVPALYTLTLRECQILWDMAKVKQEDFEAADPTWDADKRAEHLAARIRRMEEPAFKMALATIAYRRKHPSVQIERAEELAGDANNLEFTVAMILGGDEVDPTRPLSRIYLQLQERKSNSKTSSETGGSGPSSESTGTEPDTIPATTGISE